jgi:eukaryotic-like serine/threonine-protein kinase
MTAPLTSSRPLGDRLTIHEQIAAGGSSSVHRGEYTADDGGRRPVAVKLLHRQQGDGLDADLARERSRADRLTGIRGVVEIIDVMVVDDRVAVVSPLYNTTVAERVSSLGSLDIGEALSIGRALAGTLDEVHRRGIIHGDVKPSNVFLGCEDRPHDVALGDFGVSVLDGDRTWTRSAALSLPFAAPEMIDGEPASRASDLYALGATLYHLVAGRPPFTTGTGLSGQQSPGGLAALVHRITSESPPPTERDDVPVELVGLINELLAKSPRDRPRRASHVAQRLEALRHPRNERCSARGGVDDAALPAQRDRRRQRLTVVLAGAAIVAVLSAAGVIASRNDRSTAFRSEQVPKAVDRPTASPRGSTSRPTPVDPSPSSTTPTDPVVDATSATAPTTSTATSLEPTQQPVPTTVSGYVATVPVAVPQPNAPPTTALADMPTDSPMVAAPGTGCAASGVLSCDTFETGIGGWTMRQDAKVASITVAGAVAIRHNDSGSDGGSFLRRSVALPAGATAATLRMRFRFDGAGGSDWFMNVMSITNEADAVWNVDARPGDGGTIVLTTYHQDPAGNTASDLRGVSVRPGTWYCVSLSVSPSTPQSVQVSLDGVEVASVGGPLAATLTPVMTASIGPAWVSPVSQAPDLSLDDVSIASNADAECDP